MLAALKDYEFLAGMVKDTYYPSAPVAEGQQILIRLCVAIELEKPAQLEGLYVLTHAATEEFNALAEKFYDHGSEIETVARDCIAMAFEAIAKAFGFDADREELVAPRDW